MRLSGSVHHALSWGFQHAALCRCLTRAVRGPVEGPTGGARHTYASSWLQLRRGLAQLAREGPEPGNLYELLGVARTASAAEIKAAFLARAKEMHPDTRPGAGRGSDWMAGGRRDVDAFARLVTAREVLVCPEKRALYDWELRSPGFMGGAGAAPEAHSRSSGERRRAERKPDARDTSSADQIPEWLTEYQQSLTGTAWERELREEYHEALLTAFLGPQLDPSVWENFPEFFETEERSDSSDPELKHIVSGRTLLGKVVEQERPVDLPQGPELSASQPPQSSSGQAAGDHREFLELHYGELGVVMKSHRSVAICPRTGSHKDCIVVHSEGELAYRVFGTFDHMAVTHQRLHAYDATNRLLFIGHQHFTPMVMHVYWYNAYTRQCVWRSRRPRLPDAHYWLFPPRTESHMIGGWYFEHFPPRKDEDEYHHHRETGPVTYFPREDNTSSNVQDLADMDLHPSLPIMVASHFACARERSDHAERMNKREESGPLDRLWTLSSASWGRRPKTL